MGCSLEMAPMKLIPVAVLALALIASLVVYRAQANQRHAAVQAQPCVGMECWPEGFPSMRRGAHRPSLPPLW